MAEPSGAEVPVTEETPLHEPGQRMDANMSSSNAADAAVEPFAAPSVGQDGCVADEMQEATRTSSEVAEETEKAEMLVSQAEDSPVEQEGNARGCSGADDTTATAAPAAVTSQQHDDRDTSNNNNNNNSNDGDGDGDGDIDGEAVDDEGRRRDLEVFVGNLPRVVSSEQLAAVIGKECMDKYVRDIRVVCYPDQACKGYAFVSVTDTDGAQRVAAALQQGQLEGRRLRVNVSVPKNRLFVGNLPRALDKTALTAQLAADLPDCPVAAVDVLMSTSNPGHNRGFAFVQFFNHTVAEKARRRMNLPKYTIQGQRPTVNWADVSEVTEAASKVYVRNLPVSHRSEDAIKLLFQGEDAKHGSVARVEIPAVRPGQQPRDFVFVHMESPDQALAAVNRLNATMIDDAELTVAIARADNSKKAGASGPASRGTGARAGPEDGRGSRRGSAAQMRRDQRRGSDGRGGGDDGDRRARRGIRSNRLHRPPAVVSHGRERGMWPPPPPPHARASSRPLGPHGVPLGYPDPGTGYPGPGYSGYYDYDSHSAAAHPPAYPPPPPPGHPGGAANAYPPPLPPRAAAAAGAAASASPYPPPVYSHPQQHHHHRAPPPLPPPAAGAAHAYHPLHTAAAAAGADAAPPPPPPMQHHAPYYYPNASGAGASTAAVAAAAPPGSYPGHPSHQTAGYSAATGAAAAYQPVLPQQHSAATAASHQHGPAAAYPSGGSVAYPAYPSANGGDQDYYRPGYSSYPQHNQVHHPHQQLHHPAASASASAGHAHPHLHHQHYQDARPPPSMPHQQSRQRWSEDARAAASLRTRYAPY